MIELSNHFLWSCHQTTHIILNSICVLLPIKIIWWGFAENFKSIESKTWYFFTSRSRKYANGGRPNRSAASGYWKATGSDQEILDREKKRIGYKKSLVFNEGRQPSKNKTGWMMHEYRIDDSHMPVNPADKTMLVSKFTL